MPAPSQPPTRPPARREPRPWTDFDRLVRARPRDRKATGSALLLALLFHGMMLTWGLPWLGKMVARSEARSLVTTAATTTAPAAPRVEYVLTPATKQDLESLRYVETNPAAPAKKPDNTNNISNRDQRAAQPVPNPLGNSDRAATNGTLENSPKFVQGDTKFSPDEPAPQPEPKPVEKPAPQPTPAQVAQQAKPATAPPVTVASAPPALPGKATGADGEGVRVTDLNAELPPDETAQPQQPERQLPPGPLTPEAVAQLAQAATPEARATARARTFAGPLVKNIVGTHEAGLVPGADAKLSPFGEYLALLYDAIASSWYAQCDQFTFGPRDWGTYVEVQYVLNADGQVESAEVVNSTASAGATQMCLNAIRNPAPYAKWGPDMRAQLGDRYTMHFTFFYE